MAYNPDFSRDPKGKFNLNNNYVSVKNGSEAYLLEDELNEMQWIQNEQRAQMVRSLFSSGIPYKTLQLTEDSEPENETICLKGYGNRDLVENAILINIKNYVPINVNGYFIKLQGDYKKDVRGNITDNNNILLKLPKEPTNDNRYDLVYLEAWFEELDITDNNDIKNNGGQLNNSIGKFEQDSRVKVETTRRVQLKWDIRVVPNAKNIEDFTVRPQDNIHYDNYVPANTILGENYSKDSNIYVSRNNPGIVDKTFYAIPLFSIYRLIGKTTVDKDNCLNQLPVSTMSSNAINGDLTIGGGGEGDDSSVINKFITFVVNKAGDLEIKNENGTYSNIHVHDIVLHDNVDAKHDIILNNNLGSFEVKNVETGQLAPMTCGNLTVKGTMTTVNSETVKIADNILELNSNVSSSTNPTENSGIEVNRGKLINSSIIWDETDDKWKAGINGDLKAILLEGKPVVRDSITINSELNNKIILQSNSNQNNYVAVADASGTIISTMGFNGKYWYAGGNRLAVINNNGLITDSEGKTTQTKDFSILNTNIAFKTLSGTNQYEINQVLDTKIATLEQDSNKVKIFSQTSDPGTIAKTNDLWIDLTNNVIKTRLSNNTWKILGAAYN